jgi:HAD superfamily hydrolase (TIGR01509 family)
VALVRRRFRAVLFDAGGTLVRVPDIPSWVEQAGGLDLRIDPEELGDAYVGVLAAVDQEPPVNDRDEAVVRFWREVLSRASGGKVSDRVARQFVAKGGEHSLPVRTYPDVRGCLDQLREDRRKLGVISNSRGESRVRQVLHQAGILSYFESVVSSGTEGIEKPDAEIFTRAVARMDVRPEEAAYVGDLVETDAKAATSAGLYGVWLNRDRATSDERLPQIFSLLELPSQIRRIERRLPFD